VEDCMIEKWVGSPTIDQNQTKTEIK
jgi:hypothetical protein